MAARVRIDWEHGERLFRAGQLSLRQVAEALGCSEAAVRKRASNQGWERDLTGRVQAAIDAELTREHAPRYKTDEKEIVQAAARMGADVVRRHRTRIKRLVELSEKLEARLDVALQALEQQDEIKDKPGALCLDSKGLELLGKMYGHLARATASLIPLERQAFNLDPRGAEKPDDADKPPVTFKMFLSGQDRARGAGNG